MCFGVRDAIHLARVHSLTRPLTILGDLVHNETVLAELRERGIAFAQKPEAVRASTVMITAHGASDKMLKSVRDHGLSIVEATCPLVHLAHRAVKDLVRDGYHPVIVGKRDHVEVRGLTEDLDDFDVILSEAEIYELQEHPRFGVAAQTTQPIEKVRNLVNVLRNHFPRSEVRFVDTVCQPTKQRQQAAVDLSRQCDVVIVIGGAHSNNTRELVETCRSACPRVHHVQTVEDLRPDWLLGAGTVGVTAGTSTPDSVIQRIEEWLEHAAATHQTETTKN